MDKSRTFGVALLFTLVSWSAQLSPASAQLCGRDLAVTFAGYTATPSTAVALESFPNASTLLPKPLPPRIANPAIFATATSAARADRTGGYPWTVTAVITHWRLGVSDAIAPVDDSVYVRAPVAMQVTIPNCREPSPRLPGSASICAPVVSAGTAAKLQATHISRCVCTGQTFEQFSDLTIASDADALAARCVSVVHGNFTINGSTGLSDGVGFPALTHVTGNASLDYTMPDHTHPRVIQAANLTSVDGTLQTAIVYSPRSAAEGTFHLGLAKLTQLTNLQLSFGVTNGTFDGLNDLLDVPGNVTASSSSELGQLLPSVEHIGGNLYYESPHGLGLYLVMNALTNVDGGVTLVLPSTNQVSGFAQLAHVGQNFDMSGFIGTTLAPQLATVGGTVIVRDNTNAPIPPHFGTAALSTHALSVHNNTQLSSLGTSGSGLSNVHVTSSAAFACNPALPAAAINAFAAANPGATVTTAGCP